ncbi:hypothetical protein [Spiroplasma endosymbiont of Amphimallon solstitiale]|uniref:hypothetical protein n=1 Tax=Spiroplasma endosymbiont of Amphimallon solstitiale TaxID=3066288 RepID=UPI00313EB673
MIFCFLSIKLLTYSLFVPSVKKVGVPTSIIRLSFALISLSSFGLIKLGLSLSTSHNNSPPPIALITFSSWPSLPSTNCKLSLLKYLVNNSSVVKLSNDFIPVVSNHNSVPIIFLGYFGYILTLLSFVFRFNISKYLVKGLSSPQLL